MSGTNNVGTNPNIVAGATAANASVLDNVTGPSLTAEGLMLYLETRLNGLDEQIDKVFKKQQSLQKIQGALNNLQSTLDSFTQDASKKSKTLSIDNEANVDAKMQQVKDTIAEIKAIDPVLGAKLEADLSAGGHILSGGGDSLYTTAEIEASKETINGTMKTLESSAQLEMIGLQSTMSARQTSIQLATNLISALHKGTDAIAANIGR